VNLADSITRLRVRRSSHRARIQNDDVGSTDIGHRRAALFPQLTLNRRSIRLRGAATKLFDVK
jgi:hypothetical protein